LEPHTGVAILDKADSISTEQKRVGGEIGKGGMKRAKAMEHERFHQRGGIRPGECIGMGGGKNRGVVIAEIKHPRE